MFTSELVLLPLVGKKVMPGAVVFELLAGYKDLVCMKLYIVASSVSPHQNSASL